MTGLGGKVKRLFGGGGPTVRVHVMIKGRIGEGWFDVDKKLKLPQGTTLGQLIDEGDARGLPLQHAIDNSPHLKDTLMINGDRCPVAEHRDRELAEGDQIYLLAPLAGG